MTAYAESTEAALIGRLMVDPKPLPDLLLRPEDFGTPAYRKAFRAMLELHAKGKPIDIATLAEAGVRVPDVLDRITPAHRAPIEEYAAIVRANSYRRSFVNSLNELVGMAEGGEDIATLATALQAETAALSEGIEPSDILGRLDLNQFQQAPPDPVLGVLAPAGTTILYGDGGDGKGWVAARLAAAMDKRVAILDFEMQPQEWGYRLSKFGLSLNDVLYFSPPTTLDRWATEQTARLLRSEGVEFLVIDSAMYAADVDDPYSPNGALAYGRARRRLNNLPALLLAHVTGNADKVFGSVFWKNECRISWRLVKDKDTRKRHLECRKANGYSWLEGKKLNVRFSEELGELEMYE